MGNGLPSAIDICCDNRPCCRHCLRERLRQSLPARCVGDDGTGCEQIGNVPTPPKQSTSALQSGLANATLNLTAQLSIAREKENTVRALVDDAFRYLNKSQWVFLRLEARNPQHHRRAGGDIQICPNLFGAPTRRFACPVGKRNAAEDIFTGGTMPSPRHQVIVSDPCSSSSGDTLATLNPPDQNSRSVWHTDACHLSRCRLSRPRQWLPRSE